MRGKLSLFTKTLEGDIWQTGQIPKETAAIFDALEVKMPAKYLDFPKPLPENQWVQHTFISTGRKLAFGRLFQGFVVSVTVQFRFGV
jgi:hypothetical protein